jgi:hypothetical protein
MPICFIASSKNHTENHIECVSGLKDLMVKVGIVKRPQKPEIGIKNGLEQIILEKF